MTSEPRTTSLHDLDLSSSPIPTPLTLLQCNTVPEAVYPVSSNSSKTHPATMPRNNPPGGQIMDMRATPTSQKLTGKYRRNGKLQSCEPCRKSKLRCDHVVPACGRCVKRGTTGQCIYHPAPLTQSPRRQTQASLPTPSTSTVHGSPDTTRTPHGEQPYSLSREISVADPASPDVAEPPALIHRAASAPPLDSQEAAVVHRNHGFLGATSYSSIFSEGLSSLDVIATDLEEAEQMQDLTITHDRITRGMHALCIFKDRVTVNRFIARWHEICEGSDGIVPEHIMKEWLLKLWIHHREVLESGDQEKIRKLSEKIWQNTRRPLVFDGKTTALEWAHLGTGPNLRWEVVGLIAVAMGLCATCLESSDRFLSEHNVTKHMLVKKMNETSRVCLSFCRECDTLDDMFVWLLMEHSALTRAYKGDRSYAAYHSIGEVNSAVVAMGLHQDIKVDANTPFFIAECRRRAMCAAHSIETSVAVLLGRPPRLSYRYCNLEMPLDLSDSQLLLTGPELAAALEGLDENGYNKAGRMLRISFYKIHFVSAPRREEILDLALGNYTPEQIIERAKEIREKTDSHWASLPSFMSRFCDEPVELDRMRPLEALLRTSARQVIRANEFLLQRVLIRKAGASSEKLIKLAQEIFHDILQVTQRHEIASMFQSDFTFLLVAHGLRSGAILAVELLKQEQLPVYPEHPLLPRSQTIQDLSVFAARLGTIDPTDGSFGTCDQGRKVITKILDKILSPDCNAHACRGLKPQQLCLDRSRETRQLELEYPATQTITEMGAGMPQMTTMAMTEPGMPMDPSVTLAYDNDFMQWFGTMDWELTDMWGGIGTL